MPPEGKNDEFHIHNYTVDINGNGVTSFDHGHMHRIEDGKVLDSESGHVHPDIFLEDLRFMRLYKKSLI